MDGERNIVQTVLKANNTFKDFSLSASFPFPLHTHINLSLFLAKPMKLSAGQQQQAAGGARERKWWTKGTFSEFMEMKSGERLLGRQALESGVCVLEEGG